MTELAIMQAYPVTNRSECAGADTWSTVNELTAQEYSTSCGSFFTTAELLEAPITTLVLFGYPSTIVKHVAV